MKTNKFTLVSVCLLAIGILAVSLPTSEEKYEKLVSELLPKTVTIYVDVSYKDPFTKKNKTGTITGSGVFVTSSGHILSCSHLFDHEYTVESISVMRQNGDTYPAVLIYKETNRDLSMLKIFEENTPFVVLEDPRSIREGQEVIAIGAPLGLSGSVTTGVISATHRDQLKYDMIQMSAAINPGNSGGPLFNLKGRLVGINVMIVSRRQFPQRSGIGFSVSASEINRFLSIFPEKRTFGRLTWKANK